MEKGNNQLTASRNDTRGRARPGWRRIAYHAAAVILGGVFIAAAFPKIMHPADFALAVMRYRLLPWFLINAFAIYLPWLELLSGILLVAVPSWRKPAALIVAGLLVVFTAAIVLNLIRGLDIACGCFSVDPQVGHIGLWNVLRNLILLGLSAVVYLKGES